MRVQPDVRIGCSGWQYRHWKGAFYPADLPQGRWLEYYASRFDTVEVNNSFYNLPDASIFAAWKHRVPPDFRYAVKGSRFLTHMKKLKDPEEPLERLFSRATKLGRKLGPMLYQLPPRWKADLDRLRTFLAALPRRRRHVIEFRDSSWYTRDVFDLLQRHRVALCLHDMPGSATGRLQIGPFVYVRFHGTDGSYGAHGEYRDATLLEWAEWLATQHHDGRDAYVYFNNDIHAHAPRDADRLRAFLTAYIRGTMTRAG